MHSTNPNDARSRRFRRCVKAVAAKGGAYDPTGVCAKSVLGRGRRRNGEAAGLAAAGELAESWHGRAPTKVTEVTEVVQYRDDVADLGGLEELIVWCNGYECVLRFGHDVRVCAAPDFPGADESHQLYFVGGDQELDVSSMDLPADRDKIDVGRMKSIVYYTRKDHLEGIPTPYEHEFGEEGGEQPLLVYDALNRHLELVGGSYCIKLRDFDGQHSAGIRD